MTTPRAKQTLKGLEAYLIPFPAESFSKPVPIKLGDTTVGRDPGNVVQIAHDSVSGNHSRISFKDGQYLITDLGSESGTLLNGRRVKTAALQHHDKLSFGDRAFIFLTKSHPEYKSGYNSILPSSHTDITISEEDVDPSELLAQRAEDAALSLFLDTKSAAAQPPDKSLLAHQRLSLLYQLSEKLRSTNELDEILDKGLELILKAIGAAERAMIVLISNPRQELRIGAVKYRDARKDADSFPISRTIVDWVLTEKMVLVSQDLSEDCRFQDSESIRIHNLNSILVVPLIKKDKVIGMLYIDGRTILDAFDQQDVAFSAAVANELSLCIENVRLQQELIQNERMAAIGLTMSNLAHNMKNLLALNQNAVDLLKLQLKELQNEKINKSWSYIQQSFTRIHNLTVNMLAFAKEQDIVLRPVSINKVILSNRDAIEQSLESKGIELALDLNPDIPPWMMDANQFQRILLNLLVNAIDAVKGKPNAKITIATQLDNDDRLKVTISDNGCGIAADRQEKIFDLFFTTKGSGGSGLGLPMVKKFVEKMGGALTLQSAPDAGATFTMSFPRKTAPVADHSSSAPDDPQ